jgi:hypothetical protein
MSRALEGFCSRQWLVTLQIDFVFSNQSTVEPDTAKAEPIRVEFNILRHRYVDSQLMHLGIRLVPRLGISPQGESL